MMTFEEFATSVTREVAGRCAGARPAVRTCDCVEWSFARANVCMKRGRHHPIEVRLEGRGGTAPYQFVASATSEELVSPLAEMILKYVTHPGANENARQ